MLIICLGGFIYLIRYTDKKSRNKQLEKLEAASKISSYELNLRKKISERLHDDIGGSIAALKMKLLNDYDIKMSVGIYPWPSQILFDKQDSKIVNLMKNFCVNKCEFFFNNFTDFFVEIDETNKNEVISKYYIKNDVHFNSLGNEKLYINFINNFND